MRRAQGRRRGMTLPELLVSGALFISLSALLAFGLQMGLRVHKFGGDVRKAEEEARNALQRMTAELRTAAALPQIGLGKLQVPSGVLWPDSYGNTFTGFYAVTNVTESDGKLASVGKNRLIFTRPSTDMGSTTFNPSDLSNYIYVEYLVPQAAPNRLLRRVHNISNGAGHRWDSNKQQWLIVPTFFENGTALVNTKEEDQLVLRLPGAKDTLEFTVSHPQYLSNLTGQAGIETGFGTTFDRMLFTVALSPTVAHYSDPGKNSRMTIKGQVKIQSGQ